jgi:Short C-terminal domain
MLVRRRPLLRTAAVGGTFAAGRAMGRRSEDQAYAYASQDQRISDLEASQGQAAQPAGAGGQQQAAGSPVLDQLNQLTSMHDQGALSDEEFAAAKAKILGS